MGLHILNLGLQGCSIGGHLVHCPPHLRINFFSKLVKEHTMVKFFEFLDWLQIEHAKESILSPPPRLNTVIKS